MLENRVFGQAEGGGIIKLHCESRSDWKWFQAATTVRNRFRSISYIDTDRIRNRRTRE